MTKEDVQGQPLTSDRHTRTGMRINKDRGGGGEEKEKEWKKKEKRTEASPSPSRRSAAAIPVPGHTDCSKYYGPAVVKTATGAILEHIVNSNTQSTLKTKQWSN